MIKIKTISLNWVIFVYCIHLIGCATLVSGTTQNISVGSNPPGATITVQPGEYQGITPTELELERGDGPYRITIDLEGYQPYSVMLTTSSNGWTWGNVLLGGILGFIVDSSTGAHIKLSPENISANLHKAGIDPQSLSKDQLYFFSTDNTLLGQLRIE